MTTRRQFISQAAIMGLVTSIADPVHEPLKKSTLVHHVFFWLKNAGSEVDRDQLITGLRNLKQIESVVALHVGIPASTAKREVVDSSYDVSELIFFEDVAGQDRYQVDPIHTKFIDDYSHLWEKVVVYDSISV
jgi:hypothetical protein